MGPLVMAAATCARCGADDATVAPRPWRRMTVVLCTGCWTNLSTVPTDRLDGFTWAWLGLLTGLVVVAAVSALIILRP